jgi:epoxyqueuosine reductase QueG
LNKKREINAKENAMAHAIPVDTLKYTETLITAGVPEKQAKAQTAALLESYETAELVTKSDLLEYESAIRNDLEKLKIGLDAGLTSIEKTMDTQFSAITWVLGMVAAGMVALLIKAFF